MAKEKVSFSMGDAIKAANRMEKEAEMLSNNAIALRALADSKGLINQLESTSNAIKNEIEKNKAYLKKEEDRVRDIGGRVQDRELMAEGEMASIEDEVKQAQKSAKEKIKQIGDDTRKNIVEKAKISDGKIKDLDKATKDAEQKASVAISKKDQAEAELDNLTRKLGGVK